MVITSQPSTSTSCPPPTATVIPVPKPRRIVFQGATKTPVPCPRKSLLKAKSLEGEEVRLRKSLIRRDTYQPIFMEREKLQRILEVAEPELKSPKTRPCSFPIGSSPNFESSKLELSSYHNQQEEPCPPDDFTMSARAIARNRGTTTNYSSLSNERPLSAYEESAEATRQRKNRRASVAVMPIMELDYRDCIVAGSANRSSTMTRRKSDDITGREFSPDFGAIRVQVEDITSVPGVMMKEDDDEKQPNGYGETSTETITEGALNESLMSNGIRRVSDWAVPIEYASSPIAQELSQSEVEERPRPPIPAMYMNTSISSTDRGEESVYSDFVLKRNSSTSSMNGKSVTLLEQIIRTHAVWYLPHMGRPEVLHLLRRMEPGNFIVRASTRENCMALSVRLAPGAHVEIDHYIIEKLVVPLKSAADSVVPQVTTAKAVRLEGSPLTFRSLPLLIEHYCVNEDELEHRLQLPSAIRACTTTKQLLSIAVMEQEFWQSEMSLSRKKTPSTSSSRNSIASSFRSSNLTNNNNTMPKCNVTSDTSTWFMDRPEESIYDEVEPRISSKTGVGGGYYAENAKNNNSPRRSSAILLTPEMALGTAAGQQKTSKKRRSSSRASSSSNSRFATVCVGDFTSLDDWNGGKVSSKNDTDETDSGLSTHSPPSKHDRLDDVTSSPKLGFLPSSTSSTLSRPRSFLRSLLSFGSSNKEHKRKESLDIDSTPRLANCEYFTPWDTNGSNMQVRTSRSAFDITTPPTRGFFGSATPKKRNGVMPSSVYQKNASSSSSNMFDDDNYTRGWKEAAYAEMTASPHHNNNHLTDPSMRTFRPPNYDEVALAGSPSSRSRPLAMRRERSDLGVMSNGLNLGIKNNAQRLAHHNESSPGPTTSGIGRVPMTPPANAADPQVQQNCVEELRRKRLQSANEMLSPNEIAKHPYGEVHSAHASPQIAMRRRNGFPSPSTSHNGFGRNAFAAIDRGRGGDHRLSVPNLIAVTDPLVPGSVGQSAKALKERLGGRTTDGELMVINEGLVTPVVRRKTFAPAMKTTTTSMDELGGQVMKKREALEAALSEKRRHPSDSMSSGSSDHSSLGRKKTPTPPSLVPPPTPSESELVWRRAKHSAPPQSKSSGPPQWSAVNHELKNRQQKIAKVLPTPQPRGHHNRNMSIVGGVGPSMADCRRSSDYAQLCEFAASSTEKNGMMHLDVHSKIEDDAVSVAGTVFNEPWDSNVWENLLDLAHHGDESTMGLKVSEPIQEEDSDSDRTAGGDSTCQMDSDEDDDDVEDEEIRWHSDRMRRPLPSDRVTVKGWEQDSDAGSSKFNTLDSRSKNGSIAGSTLRRQPEGSMSIRSLPRALSRFSNTIGMNGMSAAASCGSIDDLPTTLPSMSPLLSGRVSRAALPRSSSTDEKIGRAVQDYVEELAQVKEGDNACFGLTLRQFVQCTTDTKETDPAVVIRNVRQFINGMKNYLVKHGEGDLHRIIDEESSRLNSNQILNIDAVLEAVLHKLLLREVKPLLYHVMIKEHSKAGALQLISQNQALVRKMNLTELGFNNPESLVTPSVSIMDQVKLLMRKMQNHYSPMKKLENLMKAVGLVLACQLNGNENENPTDAMNGGHRGLPPGDDLVRWFVYILARSSTVGCEVEAWYMWELLPQPIVTQSDASYYLTSLWSAVHVLKSAEAIRRLCENDHRVLVSLDSSRHCCASPLLSTATLTRGTSAGLVQMISAATCDAFVKIAVPDEAVGCVRYATFSGVPMLTTSKLSRLVAHQQGITNPEEHGLYLIAEGFESCLAPTDCPILVHEQLKKENKPHMFAYKRHEAKIAWPRAAIC
ncbi:Protein CBR-TAG-333 [Caenorhabditis briggsae]|uniref:Protein CBR-TAG-333 n=1 Tax=Caenorhabditis briggsae TaxID=6238 RepID=A8XDM7_CAEBR|nr:Protein CBR-TAG-333 [Caenorhabditis briggsae]CAP30747.2 Protein CBR-TAG-333 [Caenorhabditis briggsae]